MNLDKLDKYFDQLKPVVSYMPEYQLVHQNAASSNGEEPMRYWLITSVWQDLRPFLMDRCLENYLNSRDEFRNYRLASHVHGCGSLTYLAAAYSSASADIVSTTEQILLEPEESERQPRRRRTVSTSLRCCTAFS